MSATGRCSRVQTRCNAISAFTRVFDTLWRCCAEPGPMRLRLRRNMGSGSAAHRQEALRSVRGTRPPLQTHLRILAAHLARVLLPSRSLRKQRAQGRPGAGLAPTVRCARIARRTDAQRHTGAAEHPAFPAQWLYGLCRALPGERCTIAPVALRLLARLDASLRASGPHDFAVRKTTPVVHETMPRATQPASTAAHPAFRDDRDTPLPRGMRW